MTGVQTCALPISVLDVRVHGDGLHRVTLAVQDASGTPVSGLESGVRVTLDGAPVEGLELTAARVLRPRSTVTLVLDAELLQGGTLADVAEDVRQLARGLQPGDRLRIVSAGGRVRTREDDASHGDRLASELGTLADGETPRLYDALLGAVRDAARLPGNRGGVVLVLSRGADGGSHHGVVDVLALARGPDRLVPVTLALLRDEGGAPEAERLRRLVEHTGGSFAGATAAYGLGPSLVDLAHRGLDLWIVAFRAPRWNRSAPSHHLSLVVEKDGASRACEADYDTADALPAAWWRAPLVWAVMASLVVIGAAVFLLTRRRQLALLVHDGDEDDGIWYELFSYPVTLGAVARNDVVIAHSQMSRNHAVLECRGRNVDLVDLNSENGTFVNGERISRRTLADGDRISLGPTVHLIYERRA